MIESDSIVAYIVTIILSFFLGLIIRNKNKTTEKLEIDESVIDKVREEKENEIKETPAADIVSEYGDAESASSDITGKQNELRERVRDRLKQNLQGNGSSGDSTDNS